MWRAVCATVEHMSTQGLSVAEDKQLSGTVLSVLCVLLYGSGFGIGKLGVVDAGPFSFLIVRFLGSAVVFAVICFVTRRALDLRLQTVLRLSAAGGFSLFAFSGFAFTALDFGINPALLSVIVALQPILVAILASSHLDERISTVSWIGFVAGFVGVYLIVSNRIFNDTTFTMSIFFAFLSMVSLSLGNFFQKRYCEAIDIFFCGAVQNLICAALCAPVILYVETFRIAPTNTTIVALSWMILAVSVGAVSILNQLISARQVNKVSSLFFLMPIVAFFLSNLLFGGELSSKQIVGIVVVCVGVFMVNTRNLLSRNSG